MGIVQNDGYNNFCVAGKNVVYFVQALGYDYKAYNLRTGASFVINREIITSNVFDACVDSNGNLLTAFMGGNGVLVFRNDSILHDDKLVSGGFYDGIEHDYVPRFLHLRTDGTYIGVFCYSGYYHESDADLPSVDIEPIDLPVNIKEIQLNPSGDNIVNQEWDNVKLPFFPEFDGARLGIRKSTGEYNHWRAIRYDSRSNEKTEIMHIVAHIGASVDYNLDFGNDDVDGILSHESGHIVVKNHQYDDPKHKHKDEKDHNDKYEIFYNVYVVGPKLPIIPDTYSVENKEFSIPIGEADDCELNFERLSIDDYMHVGWVPTLTAGQMGFMHPAFNSGVSILGLRKNIGQSKIVDVKKTASGYLILTSDGVYKSDGTTAKLLCSDFKSWNNNFRLNQVSRSSQSWSMVKR